MYLQKIMSSNNSSSNCDQGSKEDSSSKRDYANQNSGESMYGSMNHSNSGYSANIYKSSNSSQCKSSSTYEEPKKPKKVHKKFKHKPGDPAKFLTENGLTSDSGFPLSLSEVDLSAGSSSTAAAAFTKENKAIKVAQLSQCLDIIGKLKKSYDAKNSQLKIGSGGMPANEGGGDKHLKNTVPKKTKESTEPKQVQSDKDCFCVAISLHNGAIIHTTSSITSILGYPRDMWLGRSFMDFVYPKDRLKFTQQIAIDVSNPIEQHISATDMAHKKSRKTTFFCRLRMYNGLRTGKFSIKERKTVFTPFKLIICFKEMEGPEDPGQRTYPGDKSSEKCIINPQLVCLLATCIPLRTAYSIEASVRTPYSQVFVTKHDSDCKFIQVSESAIPFLGYMPQDIENSDIFKFYHPGDLAYLKRVYEKVINDRVKIIRSKPYRLRAYNGCYITVETDLSCFVNPWLKKLEFITGKHRVLDGPSRIDVFASPKEKASSETSVGGAVESLETVRAIRSLLKESFYSNTETGEQSDRRRKELASFMGTLLEEMAKVEATAPSQDMSSSTVGGTSTMVLGGGLGQHPGFSSASPPSYNQLNYNENLFRFFSSHPHTLSPNEVTAPETPPEQIKEASPGSSSNYGVNAVAAAAYKTSMTRKKKPSDDNTPNNTTESGDSGEILGTAKDNKNESMSGYSGSNSNSGTGSNSRGSRILENSAPSLTEELLYEHNKGMEKQLLSDFKNNKTMLVSYKKTVKMPMKHLKNRHMGGFNLQKPTMDKMPNLPSSGNAGNPSDSAANLTSFLEIAKNCSHEKSSSSFSDQDLNNKSGETLEQSNNNNQTAPATTPSYNNVNNPNPPDSLLNSIAIESLLDGLDGSAHHQLAPLVDQEPEGLKPLSGKSHGTNSNAHKSVSRPGSMDMFFKVEPGSILESSNIESLHSDFQNMNNTKNSFSEYGSSNSSSWLSFLRSTDETQSQTTGSSDTDNSFKEEDADNRTLEADDKTTENEENLIDCNKYVIEKSTALETILKEDLRYLECNPQSSNMNAMFGDVFITILKREGRVRPLLDETSPSLSNNSQAENETENELCSYVRQSLLNEEMTSSQEK